MFIELVSYIAYNENVLRDEVTYVRSFRFLRRHLIAVKYVFHTKNNVRPGADFFEKPL